KAILNKDMEFRIDGDIIRLSEGNFIRNGPNNSGSDKIGESSIIGKVVNEIVDFNIEKGKNTTDKIFNHNTSYTFYKNFGAANGKNCSSVVVGSNRERRFVNRLYNETIFQNSNIISRKIFLNFSLEGKYC